MPRQEVVDDGLFTWPSDDPCLIASRRDGELSFPARPGEETVLFEGPHSLAMLKMAYGKYSMVGTPSTPLM